MKKIRSSKKGFTLAELLIVVAIIGVLVGISIPIFTSQLEKSREATDIANLRAAKAAFTSMYLDGDVVTTAPSGGTAPTYYYDADAGKIVTAKPTGYGEGTGTTGSSSNTQMGYNPAADVTDYVIQCSVNTTTDTITVAFVE